MKKRTARYNSKGVKRGAPSRRTYYSTGNNYLLAMLFTNAGLVPDLTRQVQGIVSEAKPSLWSRFKRFIGRK